MRQPVLFDTSKTQQIQVAMVQTHSGSDVSLCAKTVRNTFDCIVSNVEFSLLSSLLFKTITICDNTDTYKKKQFVSQKNNDAQNSYAHSWARKGAKKNVREKIFHSGYSTSLFHPQQITNIISFNSRQDWSFASASRYYLEIHFLFSCPTVTFLLSI